jgi:hypothetical protein
MKEHRRKLITNKNTTANDLAEILKEAESITLDNLDFNKTFKEQGKILCDIKQMLVSKNNDNKPFVCNPIISSKLNDDKFQKLYENFKKGNNNNILNKTVQKSVASFATSSRITKFRKPNLDKSNSQPMSTSISISRNRDTLDDHSNKHDKIEVKKDKGNQKQIERDFRAKPKRKIMKIQITQKLKKSRSLRSKPSKQKTVKRKVKVIHSHKSKTYKISKTSTKASAKAGIKEGKKIGKKADTRTEASKSMLKTIKIGKIGKEYNVNNTYPIVLIKKRAPRKNVIYLNK